MIKEIKKYVLEDMEFSNYQEAEAAQQLLYRDLPLRAAQGFIDWLIDSEHNSYKISGERTHMELILFNGEDNTVTDGYIGWSSQVGMRDADRKSQVTPMVVKTEDLYFISETRRDKSKTVHLAWGPGEFFNSLQEMLIITGFEYPAVTENTKQHAESYISQQEPGSESEGTGSGEQTTESDTDIY